MSEASGPRDEHKHIETTELPSLPDGGLSANMPAWLRRAPSFAPTPEAEESVIDLATLTAGLELPSWLDDVAQRVSRSDPEPRPAAEVTPFEPPAEKPAETNVVEAIVQEHPVAREAHSVNLSRVPVAPVIRESPLVSSETDSDHEIVDPPYYALALLVILVAVALGLIVMLVALR